MKNVLLASLVLIGTSVSAQKLPQPSPKGSVTQTVGVTEVSISYSRPSVKGRTIFGDLVPFGKIWRTGANSATTISFDSPVSIEGTKVPAGQYAVLTVPNADAWMLMLNTNLEVSGSNGYDAKQDVVSLKIPVKGGDFMETLTFTIDNVNKDAAEISLRWDKSVVTFHVEAPALEQSLANIDKTLAEKDASPSAYASSAAFCIERNVRLKEALEWAKKSVDTDPKFYTVRTLSLAYAANGLKKEAIETAKRSLEMSKEAGNDAYIKMNQEKIAEWEAAK